MEKGGRAAQKLGKTLYQGDWDGRSNSAAPVALAAALARHSRRAHSGPRQTPRRRAYKVSLEMPLVTTGLILIMARGALVVTTALLANWSLVGLSAATLCLLLVGNARSCGAS